MPKGKQNPKEHGLNTIKYKVKVRGLQAIDRQTLAARALLSRQTAVVADLAGEVNLGTQKKSIAEKATNYRLYGEHLDVYLKKTRAS